MSVANSPRLQSELESSALGPVGFLARRGGLRGTELRVEIDPVHAGGHAEAKHKYYGGWISSAEWSVWLLDGIITLKIEMRK